MIVVSDTSVITSLIHVGQERLLQRLHVLVEAKHLRLIDSVRNLLDRLESEAGFRVSDSVREEALRLAGE